MPTQAATDVFKKAESLDLNARDLGKAKKRLQKADLKSLLDGCVHSIFHESSS